MKKNIIIWLSVSAIFLLLIFIADAQTAKQVQFYFFDQNNCSLDGYLFSGNNLMGKTENGWFNLSYDYYVNKFEKDKDLTLFGKLGNCADPADSDLYFEKSWEPFEIDNYYFSGESLFKFHAAVTPHNPARRELIAFVQPDKVKEELNNIKLTGDTLKDLTSINQYLNDKINYTSDWEFNKQENYWQTPGETLKLKHGDCEDYSVALLSLFLAYNSSLSCYNVIFTSHVSTICYIEDYYIYYDQQKTELKKKIPYKNSDTLPKLRRLKEDYFKYYGMNNTEKVHYIFNEYRFLEFENDEEFISWLYSISDRKYPVDIFEKLEQDASMLPAQETEYQEEAIEENNEQAELPTLGGFFSEYSWLLIILAICLVFLIAMLILLIAKRKN
jgi:hypothetical protein